MTDIGTGTYTILAQIAAGESWPAAPEQVTVSLGDTRSPRTAGSGGSWGAGSAGSALHSACEALKGKIVSAARTTAGRDFVVFWRQCWRSRFFRWPSDDWRPDAWFGRVGAPGRAGRPRRRGQSRGRTRQGAYRDFSQNAFGAHFAEVSVDADTGEVRLRRMGSVSSQPAASSMRRPPARRLFGGMIGGVGMALMEEGGARSPLWQFRLWRPGELPCADQR